MIDEKCMPWNKLIGLYVDRNITNKNTLREMTYELISTKFIVFCFLLLAVLVNSKGALIKSYFLVFRLLFLESYISDFPIYFIYIRFFHLVLARLTIDHREHLFC